MAVPGGGGVFTGPCSYQEMVMQHSLVQIINLMTTYYPGGIIFRTSSVYTAPVPVCYLLHPLHIHYIIYMRLLIQVFRHHGDFVFKMMVFHGC